MPEDVLDRARRLLAVDKRRLLGIAGPPGAGKSTLARWLVDRLNDAPEAVAAYLPMDGFHLSNVQLERLGRRGRKGAPDTFDVDGYRALLARLRAGTDRPIYAPGYRRDLHEPIAADLVVEPSTRLVVTEGNYLLLEDPPWDEVARALDARWYLDTPDALRRVWLVARHVAHGRRPDEAEAWVHEVDETNAARIAASRSRADLVVRLSGPLG